MDQRRLLLAFALSLALLMLYQELVLRRYPRQPPGDRIAVPEEARPAPPLSAPPLPTAASQLAAPTGAAAMITVETDVLRARITAAGARLASFELKAYRRTVAPHSEPLNLVEEGSVLPLTLELGAGETDARLIYRPDRDGLVLHGSERGQVVFTTESTRGLRLVKRYGFTGDGYLFALDAQLSGAGAPVSVGVVLSAMPAQTAAQGNAGEMAVALVHREVVQKSFSDLKQEAVALDGSRWAGFAEQYFLFAVASEKEAVRTVMTEVEGIPVTRLDVPLVGGDGSVAVYGGPKDRDELARAGHELERALDFGWFWFIAVPLLRALEMLRRVTGNYGVAIIVLTALVKVATVPLTQTTFRNMREMQKLAPQIAKLRDRYKDDQAALQKETMELYRRHRVNPLSGCLPMLLQIPIFVGLYNALVHAIELRHAPFALWIDDLSAPDRLMVAGFGVPVLTLLMGGSMFLQQWLSPPQGDPTQQRIMMLMPIMFTFMFIGFPAGLVLYWLVNNLLGIAQQYWMMRTEP